MSFRQEPVRNGAAYMDFGDGTETRVHPMTCICGCNLDVTVDPWTCPECGWQQGGDPRDAQIAELTAERDMLAKALEDAPIISKFHGPYGFDREAFIDAYEEWRAKAREALAQKQATTAQEVREGRG